MEIDRRREAFAIPETTTIPHRELEVRGAACVPSRARGDGQSRRDRGPGFLVGGEVRRLFSLIPSIVLPVKRYDAPISGASSSRTSPTARARQSDAVRESLRHILMDAPVAIMITRGAEHRFELVNTAARVLVGGRNLEGLAARAALPEVDPALFAIIDQVYETGEPVTMRDLVVTYDRNGDGQPYTDL